MMSTAGQTENQQRVVKLFCDTIGYDYLGNWIDQGGNYNIDAGLLNAFLKSQGVDAALILEPLWSSRKSRYQVAFTLSELPPMTQMVGVATGTMIKEQPEVLRALVKAWEQTVDFTYANGDEAGTLMSKRFPSVMSVDVAQSAIKNMQKVKYWSRGDIDVAGLNFWVKAMREQGEWKDNADWSKMIDQSFLPSELRRTI